MADPGTKPPGNGDPGRRAQILRAAERLLRHYGFGKTTVADIAREARVGVGTVYLEFPSKNAIVAELSIERYECVLAAMREATRGDGAPGDRLVAMFDARIQNLGKFAREGQHGADLIHCECPATKTAHERFQVLERELLAGFLADGARAGQFDVPDPDRTARVLLRLFEGYSDALLAGARASDVADEIAVAHAVILRGLLARGTKT